MAVLRVLVKMEVVEGAGGRDAGSLVGNFQILFVSAIFRPFIAFQPTMREHLTHRIMSSTPIFVSS